MRWNHQKAAVAASKRKKLSEEAMGLCKICGKTMSESKLYHHSKYHESMATCPVCNKTMTKYNLPHHISVIHNKERLNKGFNCPICDKELANKQSMTKHIEAVHEKKLVPCSMCGKEMRPRSIYLHMRDVHKVKADASIENPTL